MGNLCASVPKGQLDNQPRADGIQAKQIKVRSLFLFFVTEISILKLWLTIGYSFYMLFLCLTLSNPNS